MWRMELRDTVIHTVKKQIYVNINRENQLHGWGFAQPQVESTIDLKKWLFLCTSC